MSQFESEYFHESTYDVGTAALRKLTFALDEETAVLPDDIFGVTELLQYQNVYKHVPTTVETQYRVVVLDDIHPNVITSNACMPDYLTETVGSLATALVDHVNQVQDKHGKSPSFPPDKTWLKTHLNGIWITLPQMDVCDPYEAKLYSLGNWHKIDLVLARDKGASEWKIEFVQRTTRALIRNFFEDNPGSIGEIDEN